MGSATAGTWPVTLLLGDRRVDVAPDGLTIGRDPDNDLVLDAELVSRHHAAIRRRGDGFELVDLDSKNGTLVDGKPLHGAARALSGGETIGVGGQEIRVLVGPVTAAHDGGAQVEGRLVALDGERLTIGRDPANALVLDDPNVSRFHAEVIARDGRVELRDLRSRNGTRIDGRTVRHAALETGAEVSIGPFRLVFDGLAFRTRDDRGAVRLAADDVAVQARGRRILAPTSLCIESGELVAIIGRSGCGKTTLLKTLCGMLEPAQGTVKLNGEPVSQRRTDVGYLPQDEIVHPRLTPREALRYAARLRLPPDVDESELHGMVERVLEELSLAHRADTWIEALSGGERKRAGLAVELLGRPSVLCLDEPTTGLDPDLEAQTMQMLRRLADRGRAVVVVTHATGSLELCDRVAVFARDGRLRYVGPPRDALAHFAVRGYDEMYEAVERASHDPQPPDKAAPGPRARPLPRVRRPPSSREVRVLVARYVRLIARDRRNLALLLGQVPVLALAIGALFGHDVFERTRGGNPNDAAQVLFLLVTVSIWIGTIAAAREIVKERAVFARERAAGVRVGSYLASKALVLCALAAAQTAALGGIVLALRPLHEQPATYAVVLLLLVATSFVAVAMGLALSSVARSQDQASSLVPLVLVPQLLFAGAIVPVSKMGGALKAISALAASRWAFSGLGTAIHMARRLAGDPFDARHSPYGHHFFTTGAGEALAILAAFMVVLGAAVAVLVRRRA
jgi:ABC-type multidrug transport system ATPase subunit/pSer/pThr/pTyr-binding forkhead associated (FHA) protein/ABC-type multidrug transport system permease subunit